MQRHQLLLIAATVLTLSACAPDSGPAPKATAQPQAIATPDTPAYGTGSVRVNALISRTLLGSDLATAVGGDLDDNDVALYISASQRAMINRIGSNTTWRNPQNKHHGVIIPGKPFQNAAGRNCRTYTQTVYVDRQAHRDNGTACRDDISVWRRQE